MRDHTDFLINRGSAYPELFDAIETIRDEFDFPVCALAFQLPFPLHTTSEFYSVARKRQKVTVYLRFLPIQVSVSPDFRISVSGLGTVGATPAGTDGRTFDCTQCIASIPLWGTRLEYYEKYLDLVQRRRPDDVVIPSQWNPYHDSMPGAVTAHMFEANMAERSLTEANLAIRRFLRDYMIVTLEEVPLPKNLYSIFAVTAPDRIFSFGPYYSIGFGLFARHRSTAIRAATADAMATALKWPIREFSSFELQIFALKRLADNGEPALALVGLMALVEWYLNENLPERGRQRLSLSAIVRHPHYDFVPSDIKTAIDAHRKIRNFIVHEQPTDKTAHHDPQSGAVGARAPDSSAAGSFTAFYEAAAAGFELYRLVNMNTHKARQGVSRSRAGTPAIS